MHFHFGVGQIPCHHNGGNQSRSGFLWKLVHPLVDLVPRFGTEEFDSLIVFKEYVVVFHTTNIQQSESKVKGSIVTICDYGFSCYSKLRGDPNPAALDARILSVHNHKLLVLFNTGMIHTVHIKVGYIHVEDIPKVMIHIEVIISLELVKRMKWIIC